MAIGIMEMSASDLKSQGKGIAIEVVQFLNDAVWKDLS